MFPPYLSEKSLMDIIRRGLSEDVGPGDVTTAAIVDASLQATGTFLAKEDGVLAGLEVATRVMHMVDETSRLEWIYRDGDYVPAGTVFGRVHGWAYSLLVAERLSLNFMQRMSGIATLTRRMVEAAKPHKAAILDTRKTAPGLRLLDKWAVLLGGGRNHRIGLYDMMLVKDNHITAAGGVVPAIHAALHYMEANGQVLELEIEARTLEEVDQILEVGCVDYVLLDNMARRTADGGIDATMLAEAVARIDGKIATEASGNVLLDTVPAIAATGVDFISCGALTHSVTAMDISLKIQLEI